MPTPILICHGRPCVELRDHRKRWYAYAISVVAVNGKPAVQLEKLGDPNDPVYTVTFNPWRCDCGSAVYKAGLVENMCKHARAVRDIAALLSITREIDRCNSPPPTGETPSAARSSRCATMRCSAS